jgi:hypothetical protein
MREEKDSHEISGSIASGQNSIFVIAPYWSSGTWVFDDPSRDLTREPFVSGVPEILNQLVTDIPNAKQGFRLLFAAAPFPGYQAHYQQLSSEYSGTWYKTSDGKKGWLCPALFKYYSTAPKDLYVRAEVLE